MKESHMRSILKGMTWRVIASVTTMTLVYIFTGDFLLVAEVGLFDITVKIAFYYFHERAWGSVAWGLVPSKSDLKPRT